MINGADKPSEYRNNKKIALNMVSSIAAKVNIEPNIGPIQGVHPNPKAKPIKEYKFAHIVGCDGIDKPNVHYR